METKKECSGLFRTTPGSNILQNICFTATYLPSHKDEQDMRGNAGEERKNLLAMLFYRLLHLDVPVVFDQQIYISSVSTLDAVKKTYQERWTIGTDGENVSKNSELSARLHDDEKNIFT